MPRIQYISKKFGVEALKIIDQADTICRDYAAQGYDLTLRQLYYQFVARGIIPNKDTEYKRLGQIINDARLAGRLDWNYIVDRTRNLRSIGHWGNPNEILDSAAASYATDRWRDQAYRPEVWIEKDALAGVIQGVCTELDVPYFSCRGYTSQSEVWGAGRRMRRYLNAGQAPVVFHLGDHDPSGIDMTRDVRERLAMFAEAPVKLDRLALNMDQVEQYNPPPNPAKLTDSRCIGYMAIHGDESWELDALEPTVIGDLIRAAVATVRDDAKWDAATERQELERAQVRRVAHNWGMVQDYLDDEVGPALLPDDEDDDGDGDA